MARKKVAQNDEALEIKDKFADDANEAETQAEDAIVDIDLSAIRKKRFRIDGDNDRILYLDTSDFSILTRYEKMLPKIGECVKASVKGESDVEDMEAVDAELRKIIDEIFDSNVSEVCAPSGYMFDLFNGELRFEHIMRTLLSLYEQNIAREYRKISRNIAKYTDKYTKK